MKIVAEERLFWFLKEGATLDLEVPSEFDLYLRQVFTRGRTEDVKRLLKIVDPLKLAQGVERIKRFLPADVRSFWEDFLGNP